MAEVTTSPVTNFDIVNYTGMLFRTTPSKTPIATILGGIRNVSPIGSTHWTWQTEDNDLAEQAAPVEGADPTYTARDRSEVVQVLQIFQYGVNISYSKMGAIQQVDPSAGGHWLGNQPVGDEVAHQLGLKLERMKRDLEFSILRGVYAKPANNSTGRTMRGMENAITTHAIDAATAVGAATFDFVGGGVDDEWTDTAHGLVTGDEIQFIAVGTGAPEFLIDTPYWVIRVDANTYQLAASMDDALAGTQIQGTVDSTGTWTVAKSNRNTKALMNKLVRSMAGATDDEGAPWRMPVLVAGSFNKQRLSDVYGYAPESRNVGGLSLQQIELDLIETVPIIYDPFMPKDKIFLLDLAFLMLKGMPIKGRGVVFFEPRADTGASEHHQLYAELGLDYGPEEFHGAITGLTTDEQVS